MSDSTISEVYFQESDAERQEIELALGILEQNYRQYLLDKLYVGKCIKNRNFIAELLPVLERMYNYKNSINALDRINALNAGATVNEITIIRLSVESELNINN
ncbi:MAG: hypothetical protein KAS32_15410 [Candidatus Peribacteraceae bacterium]|nr:hypothetical protein [Candidatus Peribacteraceae bacterium]